MRIMKHKAPLAFFLFAAGISAVFLFSASRRGMFWQPEDFVFYDSEGNQAVSTSLQTPFIAALEAKDMLFTFRGMAVGEDAPSALARYEWDDFEMVLFRKGEAYGDVALTNAYRSRIRTADDLIGFLDEWENDGVAAKISVLVFKQRGRLVTRSQLSSSDGFEPYEKLKYVFAVEIEARKIYSVTIENNYYEELSVCLEKNQGVIPPEKEYDWLRTLGDQ